MLRDEDGVTAHRRLLAVAQRLGRREPLRNKVSRMLAHGAKAAVGEIGTLLVAQAEAAAERRGSEPVKDEIKIAHRL